MGRIGCGCDWDETNGVWVKVCMMHQLYPTLLAPVERTYDADELGIDQEEDD